MFSSRRAAWLLPIVCALAGSAFGQDTKTADAQKGSTNTPTRSDLVLRCRTKDGKAVAGAEVWFIVYGLDEDGEQPRAQRLGPYLSNKDGVVSCTPKDRRLQNVAVYARKRGKLVGLANRPAPWAKNDTGSGMSDKPGRPSLLTMWPSTSLRGKVQAPKGHDRREVTVELAILREPIPFASQTQHFSIYDFGRVALPPSLVTKIAADGSFTLTDVPQGSSVSLRFRGAKLGSEQMFIKSVGAKSFVRARLQKEGILTGTVLDPSGKPVAGQRIAAMCMDDSGMPYLPAAEAVTDDAGRYRLPQLPARRVELVITPRTAGSIYLSRLHTARSGRVVEANVRFRPGVRIRGAVYDDRGSPVEGVTLLGMRGLMPTGRGAVTGRDGGFALYASLGKVELYVRRVPKQYIQPEGVQRTLDVRNGKAPPRLRLVLKHKQKPKPGPFVVYCTSSDGKSVANAEVHFFQCEHAAKAWNGKAYRYRQLGPYRSDTDGIAKCRRLPKMRYGFLWVHARVAGKLAGVGQILLRKPTADAKPLQQANAAKPLRVVLLPVQKLRGQVDLPDGVAAKRVRVEMISMRVLDGMHKQGNFVFGSSFPRDDSWPGLDRAMTELMATELDKDGKFEFVDVPTKSVVYLRFRGEGLGEAQWSNHRERKLPDPNKDIAVAMEPEAEVAGRVLDPAGKPVAGAEIQGQLTGETPGISVLTRFRTRSGADGKYSFRGLPSCRLLITVKPGPATSAFHPTNVIAKSAQVLPIDLKLEKALRVGGIVVDTAGKPVAGAYVGATCEASNGQPFLHVKTNQEGRFELPLPSGAFDVYFSSLPRGFVYPEPQIVKKLKLKHGEAIDELRLVLSRAKR